MRTATVFCRLGDTDVSFLEDEETTGAPPALSVRFMRRHTGAAGCDCTITGLLRVRPGCDQWLAGWLAGCRHPNATKALSDAAIQAFTKCAAGMAHGLA